MTQPLDPGAHGGGWICCHLGAREHYAVPRALHRRGRLGRLVTDAWAPPGGPWSRLAPAFSQRLADRFHPELAGTAVTAFTASLLAREAIWRISGVGGWDRVVARNRWFGRKAAGVNERLHSGPAATVFAHSYSALEVFRRARSRGWTTVLGQIDPGVTHYERLEQLAATWPEFGPAPPFPPPSYFEAWREECALAEHIVVNSPWSRDALALAGVDLSKVRVVPLDYTHEGPAPATARRYPVRFSTGRPCRVLFVGTAGVAKGVPPLLDAVAQLADQPIELRLVGECAMRVPSRYMRHAAIRWVGPVSRTAVMEHYRQADVLVFPSYSDGFGMAQVEAQAWGLPVIASRNCGRVVTDGVNGLLLGEVTADAIASALRSVVADPARLASFSAHATASSRNVSMELADGLCALERP